ncbi:MAG: YhjD/YihY/BrkB family envelope integrity protein [Planctomycetota bacterium]
MSVGAREHERSPGLRETVRMVRFALRGLFASRLPQMAAALAFRTLFALIPMLVISVAVIGAFADPDQVRATLDKALESSGVSEIVISEPADEREPEAGTREPRSDGQASTNQDSVEPKAGGPGTADLAPSEPEGDSGAAQVVPASDESSGATIAENPALMDADTGAVGTGDADGTVFLDDGATDDNGEVRLEAFLNDLVTRLLEIPFAAIGAAGLLTLIYAAISMLTEIEKAFNQVYRARTLRSWGRRITQYWSVLTLGSLLIFTAFYTSEQFRGFDTEGLSSFVSGALAISVSVAITTLLLLLGYQTIPNTRVHVRTSLVGALVAAILWEVAKYAFRQYIDFSVSYAKLYGSIGVLPLFMLWIYATWLIVLFGLQVSYGLQHLSVAREMMEQQGDESALTDPASVIAVLARLGERFRQGKPSDAGDASEAAGIPVPAAAGMLEALERAGMIHTVGGEDETYALAKPPESIELGAALEVVYRLAHSPRLGSGHARPMLTRLRQAESAALDGATLADVLGPASDDEQGSRSEAGS